MGHHIACVLLSLFLVGRASSGEQIEMKKASGNFAQVVLDDGSSVRVLVLQPTIEVKTKFGVLVIPVDQLRRIDFGFRLRDGQHNQIEKAVLALGSQVYREREEAQKFLIALGYRAYPMLKKVGRPHADLEVEKRLGPIMEKIRSVTPVELLNMKEEDVVHTDDFPIVGRISGSSIKIHSVHFGEHSLSLSGMRTFTAIFGSRDLVVSVDASKYGSAIGQWMETDVLIDTGQSVVIVGEGKVDLWPAGPGQYMAEPGGYTSAGRIMGFQAGALIGKIGSGGKEFLIGKRYEGSGNTSGKLYLHIVPNQWNSGSSGSYSVSIIVGAYKR